MTEPVKEIRGQFSDITVISELRGAYPNVPIAVDIDYAALVAGDPEPTFVTLPIGKANVKSGNGRYYDEAFLTELMRQTLESKPIGLMGHLSDAERATAFPNESLHWVGAVREGDILWGKAYILGEARDRVRRYKAAGKSIATSIDAYASGTWDESLGAYRMDASTLRLNQIDLAPSDRAGIAALARVPLLTTETQNPSIVEVQTQPTEDKNVDKLTVINEMTADDARLLPDPVRAAIVATVPAPAEVATVAAIREILGLDPKADLAGAIAEICRVQAEQAKAAVTSKITELVNAGIKIEDVRPLVTELVTARLSAVSAQAGTPQTVQAAEDAYKAVVALDSVTKILASHVQEQMGPPQRKPVQSQQGKATYFNIPQKETANA